VEKKSVQFWHIKDGAVVFGKLALDTNSHVDSNKDAISETKETIRELA